MVNPWYRRSKNSPGQVKRISVVDERQFKRNEGIGRIKTIISLDVEMDVLRFDVHISNKILGNCITEIKFVEMPLHSVKT